MRVFVIEVAHDFLEDIAHRHQTRRSAVLVDDQGHLRFLTLEHLEQLHHGHALGHRHDAAHAHVVHRAFGRQVVQVFHAHEAHDVVFVAAIHRETRELCLGDDAHVFFQRVVHAQAHHIGTRRHERFGVFVSDVENVIHELVLLRRDKAAFSGLVDEQLDFVVGVHLMLVSRIVARNAHHRIGDAVEQHHNGIGDLIERHERACGEQCIALGGENRERLGNELTRHHMQRGHDEVANGHRHHGNRSFGQAEQHEQRSNEGRKRRLTQPTQSKRCKSNAQLAGGQILVHIQGNFHSRLGARLALLYGELELRLTHTHEREFGDDEKCVHCQEKYDEDKAYANRHERKFTLSKRPSRRRPNLRRYAVLTIAIRNYNENAAILCYEGTRLCPTVTKTAAPHEKCAATKERNENEGIHREQHAQTPNPPAANVQKGGAATAHRGSRTCPNGDA